MSNNSIVQISDTHLFGDKNRKINGSNSYQNLKEVMNHLLALKRKPDLIIVSGDLSQDCTFESYQHLANLLNTSGIKYYLFPGNHDDVDVINKVFDFNWIKNRVDYSFDFNKWFINVIDTSVYPEVVGELSEDQLKNFEKSLSQNKNKPTIVFMHHHPLPVGSKWLDNYILNDAEKFNSIVKLNPQIKAVLFGHIHQVFEKNIDGKFYGSAPASCYQVLPKAEMFTIQNLNAGYRSIELDGDKFSSKVVWI